ncbi:MAG: SDR family NAD(P)-dependent oxidoreductase [Bacteroidetes bacterium]|nr:SDR family NAD(P)-dependent oxidoreductase [Bacteroidota bacterium]
MESLKGKNVVLIGASGGIGEKTAKLLASSGANLCITGRDMLKLKAVAETANIPLTQVFEMDLADELSVKNSFSLIQLQMPVIDILVNAAGVGIIKPMETLSAEEFRLSLNTNLVGVFYLMQSVLPGMKEQKKGLIINIPGVLGKVPMAGAAAYSASKFGLVGMMQSIREEIKRTEIRITNLFLGGVDSPFWDHIDLRVQRDKMVMAEEAAKAIWFLCQQPRSGVVSEMVLQPFNHQAI